jgi:type II restriction enzyme
MALTGNKGEWSEIYVFLYLLGKGKLDVADENLNAVPGEFYKILEIIRKEAQSTNNYIREDDTIKILVTNDKTGEEDTFRFPIIDFVEKTKVLIERLKNTKEKSHPTIEAFLSQLKVSSIKDYGHKRDITIKIEDFHCGMAQTLGFSIKSFLGSDSTLFNAGAGTNFIYEIRFPDNSKIDVDAFNADTYKQTPRIPSRLKSLINDYKAEIVFQKVQSRCLSQNLRTIDGDLPSLIAQLLMIRYLENETTIARCTEILTQQNPLDFDTENHGAVYEYKIKRFLQDCALGMVPEKPWLGVYDATGGQIIVKEDGQVVCYHIYEQNRFLNYLFHSTKFEGASTSEDENNPGHPREKVAGKTLKPFFYGWLYEEDGKYYFKINLQVRFK